MLNKRVGSAIIGIPLFIFILYTGGILFLLTVLLLAGLGLNEFYNLTEKKGVKPHKTLGLFSGLCLLVVVYLSSKQLISDFTPYLVLVGTLYFILLSNLFIINNGNTGKKNSAILDTGVTILGILYVCGLLLYLILIYNFELSGVKLGKRLVWLPILITWLTDTFAYFTGLNFGKHKLAPGISPKKTIEGAIGGICGGILAALVYSLWLPIGFKESIILGSLISLAAQLGDLVESTFKRDAEIKDSGSIIPGHGGVLDRFDSLLFALPVTYYYFHFFV